MKNHNSKDSEEYLIRLLSENPKLGISNKQYSIGGKIKNVKLVVMDRLTDSEFTKVLKRLKSMKSNLGNRP